MGYISSGTKPAGARRWSLTII